MGLRWRRPPQAPGVLGGRLASRLLVESTPGTAAWASA
jgi:hypothetical protein